MKSKVNSLAIFLAFHHKAREDIYSSYQKIHLYLRSRYNFVSFSFLKTLVSLNNPKSIPVIPGITFFAHAVASVAANSSHGTSGPSNSCSANDGKLSSGKRR